MTLRQASQIVQELLADNRDPRDTMHHVLSPQRVAALNKLLLHAQQRPRRDGGR